MSLAPITLWLAALMFLVFGAWLLAAPGKLDDWLGLVATTPEARTELRALYGGLELGIAAFCTYCAVSPSRYAVGCAAVALLLGGIAVARSYGMVADGTVTTKMFTFLGTEVGMAALACVAWFRATTD